MRLMVVQVATALFTIRQTRGDDIDAACGQLVGQVADRTRRAEQWKKKVAEKNEILRSQG